MRKLILLLYILPVVSLIQCETPLNYGEYCFASWCGSDTNPYNATRVDYTICEYSNEDECIAQYSLPNWKSTDFREFTPQKNTIKIKVYVEINSSPKIEGWVQSVYYINEDPMETGMRNVIQLDYNLLVGDTEP